MLVPIILLPQIWLFCSHWTWLFRVLNETFFMKQTYAHMCLFGDKKGSRFWRKCLLLFDCFTNKICIREGLLYGYYAILWKVEKGQFHENPNLIAARTSSKSSAVSPDLDSSNSVIWRGNLLLHKEEVKGTVSQKLTPSFESSCFKDWTEMIIFLKH